MKIFLWLLILSVIIVFGKLDASAITSNKDFSPTFHPKIEIMRTSGSIKIDGMLNDNGWENASVVSNFSEQYPGDLIEPPVKTRVMMTYDKSNLYIAFVCQDRGEEVRASHCERDYIKNDDNIGISIDTYGDAAWAYILIANPLGIQGDALWSREKGEDYNFDMIWYSEGKVADSGYQVEIAIPFSSLRFPGNLEQDWNINFFRNHRRHSNHEITWSAIDRNEDCKPCQWGQLSGIRNVSPGTGIDFIPSITACQIGKKESSGNIGYDNPEGEFGFSSKYLLASNATIEATINPDFSQIESDPAIIDINTTFALFFEDKRPFFQEGIDLFRTFFELFYTRSINSPIFAAKGTYRGDKTNIACLVSYDKDSYVIIPHEEYSEIRGAGKSKIGVGRIQQMFGQNSHLGVLATGRYFDQGGSNSVLSVDGQWRISQPVQINWQGVGSYTKEDNDRFYGQASTVSIRYASRKFYSTLRYFGSSSEFRADNGFEAENNYHKSHLFLQYSIYPNGRLLEKYSLWAILYNVWNYNGLDKKGVVTVNGELNFKFAQTRFFGLYSDRKERYQNIKFNNLWFLRTGFTSTPSKGISFECVIEYGNKIDRYFAIVGREIRSNLTLNLQPTDRAKIQNTIRISRSKANTNISKIYTIGEDSRLVRFDKNDRLYSQKIIRTSFSYKITKAMSFRLALQYNDRNRTVLAIDNLPGDNYLSNTQIRSWNIDPLLTFAPNPFSIIYIGMTHNYNAINDDVIELQQCQYYAKLQYLFQL